MLRRRRGEHAEQAGPGETGWAEEETETGAGEAVAGGPWDVHDDVPPAERIDFGCMQVPLADGCEVQVSMADDQVAWITVVRGDSGLQLQAFAAPKTGGLWADVRQEIAAEVAKAGGASEEADGPFGAEVHARIASPEPVPGAAGGLHPVRFLGVDGPRWFLRGMLSGPAAADPEAAALLEQAFRATVVVRGSQPMPVRDPLPLTLPPQAAAQLAQQQAAGGAGPAPDGRTLEP